MPVYTQTDGCRCPLGSMTQALRAQKLLANAAIRTSIVKNREGEGRRGCSYALSYPCSQERNVYTLLEKAGIRPKGGYGGTNGDLPG